MATDAYDVIIIGSGAGGGTLARHLAPSGKRILLLERGDWLPREPQNWSDQDVFVDNRYVSPDTWYDASGKPFQPGVHYFVGGATKLYGAALYRLRKEDFGELQHHDGISPAWPIAYDELEPYYSLAEQLYHVHGARGEDPTEPPASAPYPHPAVSHEPRIQQLADDLAAAGYHPFHAPCGIMLDEANPPYSTCIRCATCDGFPCLVHAKSDAEVLGVRPALEHPNVTLRTNAKVVRLETNAEGTAVTEVVVERDGAEERFAGDVVVVACGAANTAKLLLQSASDKHPNGLANGSDQVGRNYMFHDSTAVLALSREENTTVYPEDARAQRLLLRERRLRVPARQRPDGRQVAAPMFRGERPRRHEARARVDARADGAPRDRLLALHGGPPAAGQPRHRRAGRQRQADLHGDEPGGQEAALREGQVDARAAGHEPGPPHPPLRVHEERHPDRGLRAPGGHLPVRYRPGDVSAGRELQGARARQPVRRRHERLPEHRRREPGPHGDGELAPRRRPPPRAAGGTCTGGSMRAAHRPASRSRSRSATSAWSSSRSAAGCARTRSPAALSSTATAPTRCARRAAGRC